MTTKPLSFTEQEKIFDRQYQSVKGLAANKLGRMEGWYIVGPHIRRAFVAQEILSGVALVPESTVSAENLQKMLNALYARLNNDEELSI